MVKRETPARTREWEAQAAVIDVALAVVRLDEYCFQTNTLISE